LAVGNPGDREEADLEIGVPRRSQAR